MKKIILAAVVLIVAVLVGYSGTTMMLNSDRFLAKPDANGAAYGVTKVFNFQRDWDSEVVNSAGPCRKVIDNYKAQKNYGDTIDGLLKKVKAGSAEQKKLLEQKKRSDELLKKALKAVEECADKK